MTAQDAWNQLNNGNRKAETLIFDTFYPRLVILSYQLLHRCKEHVKGLLKDEAHDIASDSLMVLFLLDKKGSKKKDIHNIGGYLHKICENKCLNFCKKLRNQAIKREEMKIGTYASNDPINVKDEADHKQYRIGQAIQFLSERERQIWALRLEGYSHEIIGERVGINKQSVTNAVNRIRNSLKEKLKDL